MDYVSMFAELSEWGQRADHLMANGQFEDAHQLFDRILETMEDNQKIDPFLLGKMTLSRLRLLLHQGQIQDAFALWRGDTDEDGLNGLGIRFISSGQLSLNDLGIYFRLSAYFRSQALGLTDRICEDVDTDMEKVWELEREAAAPDERLTTLLTLWRFCHLKACKGDLSRVPEASLQMWTDHMVAAGVDMTAYLETEISQQPLTSFFPALDGWRLHWMPDGVIEQYEIGPDYESIRKVIEIKDGLPIRVLHDGAA